MDLLTIASANSRCARGTGLLALALATTTAAADWPRYRGPAGDGVAAESVERAWPASGPKVAWKIPTPGGFSSLAVQGNRAYTLVRRAVDGVDREVCVALDTGTGKEVWAAPVGIAKYDGGGDSGTPQNKGGDGPRSTPTADGDRVFTFSAHLVLTALEADSGKVVWTRDLLRDHAGRNISWQNAASPVVDGDLLFAAGGGEGQALLALNKRDGQIVWKSQNDLMTHATPVVATLHGIRQVIFFTQAGLAALRTTDGQLLWRHPFKYHVSTAASPVVAGHVVYCSAGYGVGGTALRIAHTDGKFTATELWRIVGDRQVANHWSTPVVKDGFLYGMFSFKQYGVGPLKCVEIATGKVRWEQKGFGAGNLILAGNHLLALSDAGELVLVAATPDRYQEVARADVLDGKCWSTPALAGGRAYVRSTREAVCLDLSEVMAKP